MTKIVAGQRYRLPSGSVILVGRIRNMLVHCSYAHDESPVDFDLDFLERFGRLTTV